MYCTRTSWIGQRPATSAMLLRDPSVLWRAGLRTRCLSWSLWPHSSARGTAGARSGPAQPQPSWPPIQSTTASARPRQPARRPAPGVQRCLWASLPSAACRRLLRTLRKALRPVKLCAWPQDWWLCLDCWLSHGRDGRLLRCLRCDRACAAMLSTQRMHAAWESEVLQGTRCCPIANSLTCGGTAQHAKRVPLAGGHSIHAAAQASAARVPASCHPAARTGAHALAAPAFPLTPSDQAQPTVPAQLTRAGCALQMRTTLLFFKVCHADMRSLGAPRPAPLIHDP